jgi:hypothetical protein
VCVNSSMKQCRLWHFWSSQTGRILRQNHEQTCNSDCIDPVFRSDCRTSKASITAYYGSIHELPFSSEYSCQRTKDRQANCMSHVAPKCKAGRKCSQEWEFNCTSMQDGFPGRKTSKTHHLVLDQRLFLWVSYMCGRTGHRRSLVVNGFG